MVKKFAFFLGLLGLSLSSQAFSASGLDPGANMAVQLNVAFSADCEGVGLFWGVPYYCAQGSSVTSDTACSEAGYLINIDALVQYTKEQASAGNIDDVANLANNRVWIFESSEDITTINSVRKKLYAYYQSFMNTSRITTATNLVVEYGWITVDKGNPCDFPDLPYINKCNVDAAGLLLKTIYGTLKPPVTQNSSNLYSFPQHEFVSNSSAGMDTFGYIYQPEYCVDNPCKVHVALHSWKQNHYWIGLEFVKDTGLNEWAEANNIIVIYPQCLTLGQINYFGSWDYWGYTGPNYALKSGIQMAGIYNITQRLDVVTSFRPGKKKFTKK